MKKRIKIKKIILSCFTAICLGLGLIAPFITNDHDIVVSASNTSGAEFTSNGFTYSQIVTHLDGTEDFLEKYYKPIESSSNLQSLESNTIINFGSLKFNSFNTGDDFCYYFNNTGFGDSYGFSISSYTGFFNGFEFVLDDSGTAYDIYLANITANSNGGYPSVYNSVLLNSSDTYYFTYSSTDEISASYFGISGGNIGTFMSWFYNYFLKFFGNTYTMSKWHSGNIIAFNFADYFALVDYFNIARTLKSFSSVYSFDLSGNIIMEGHLLCTEGILNTTYFSLTTPNTFRFDNMTLDELSFIYTICSLNFYPANLMADISVFPTYYRLNRLSNINYSINGVYMTYVNLDNSSIPNIHGINFNVDSGDISISYRVGDSYTASTIYNKFTHNWFTPFSANNNYFFFARYEPIASNTLNQLLYVGTPYDSLPENVKGWYTFDIAPFDSISDSVDIDLDISFTADSKGYNNLRIIGDTIQGTYVGTIYYRNLDTERNVINEYVPYQYQRLPYQSEWTSFNARQLFFDETLIDGNFFDILNDMGVFTFISNNPNNNQTMVDLFWGIAEVPIVTVRKVFDFEILGTNVTNFIMSMITISIILFLIRRLF